MKVLGLVVSDKKNLESFILKTYFLTPWPTYATNWNGLNNFDRGPPRDHSCEVWSKSKRRFQRTCRLKKLLTHARTDARTDDETFTGIAVDSVDSVDIVCLFAHIYFVLWYHAYIFLYCVYPLDCFLRRSCILIYISGQLYMCFCLDILR